MHPTPPFNIAASLSLFALLCVSVNGQTALPSEVTATKCWSHPISAGTSGRIVADDAAVYFGGADAEIISVAADGKRYWSSALGGEVTSNLLPSAAGLFLVTRAVQAPEGKSGESTLRLLNRNTGLPGFSTHLNDGSRHWLGSHGDRVIAISSSGAIQSINAESGKMGWERILAAGFDADPVFDGKQLILTSGRQMFTLILDTGEIESLRKTANPVSAIAAGPVGLAAGDERGNVSFYKSGAEKPSWNFKTGGRVSAVTLLGDTIIVTSHDNFIYLLSARQGDVTWKRRLDGRITHIGLLSLRYMLAGTVTGGTAVVIDLANGKPAGQLLLDESELIMQKPVTFGDHVYLVTTKAAYDVSVGGCSETKKAVAKH